MRRALIAGVAILGLAGMASPVLAKTPETHTMTIEIPGGGVAEVQYTGNVPPTITFEPGVGPAFSVASVPGLFGPNSPFAMMQRISAEMNRETAALIREVESTTRALWSAPLVPATFGKFGPGTSGYTFVSTITGNGVCTEGMQITYSRNGTPKVAYSHSGDCGPQGGSAPVTAQTLPVPSRAKPTLPGTILVSSPGPFDVHLVRGATWQH